MYKKAEAAKKSVNLCRMKSKLKLHCRRKMMKFNVLLQMSVGIFSIFPGMSCNFCVYSLTCRVTFKSMCINFNQEIIIFTKKWHVHVMRWCCNDGRAQGCS